MHSAPRTALGDFVGGSWLPPQGEPLESSNPARDGEPVFTTAADPARVDRACAAAAAVQHDWAALSRDERWQALTSFRDALAAREDALAEAIRLETGKIASEARGEARTVIARFDAVREQVARDLAEGPLPGAPSERSRYHALGVVGVIGPFNFPLHLCNAHIVPALLLGNTVVVKPSEVTPLSMQRYFEAAAASALPPGVLNLVQGRGDAGARLVSDPHVRGLCFTGSYGVGKRITAAAVERPELLVALEMGGKNTAVVFDDADLRQAVHEIVVGAYLTTGQRCTATSRVLVHERRRDAFCEALRAVVPSLAFGDPEDPHSFAGPLTTRSGRDAFRAALAMARAGGAEPIVTGEARPGGWYVAPSVHLLPAGCEGIEGYTDAELFGPDLAVQTFADEADAARILEHNPYGLANTVFTADHARFERLFVRNHSGILNWNRTTNSASGKLAFGGVGRSGNYRPAGGWAPRNLAYPVAVIEQLSREGAVHTALADLLPAPDLDLLERQHAAEEAEEAERWDSPPPRPMAMRRPTGGALPRSEAYLRRLYAGGRVAREKKSPVYDHARSWGPWMVSIDDEPLSVLDGMSQTATLPDGFAPDAVVAGYFAGRFGSLLVESPDPTIAVPGDATDAVETLRDVLRDRFAPQLAHITFANSGAEANEKALALCLLHAKPGARRVLSFEGSFHGRALLTLHATHSPSKRTPYELAGYEATFAPYPLRRATDLRDEPSDPPGWLDAAAEGDFSAIDAAGDSLLEAEIESLEAVDAALAAGDIFAVLIEPMQSEGGDRYASARFHRALRLLTRRHEVALVMDEVQTGFGLGGTFLWHERFGLVDATGAPDSPDCVTVAKRAQVGVCASRFADPEPTAAHPASLVRGAIHAELVDDGEEAARIEALVRPRLADVARRFPELVGEPRAEGFAFAFDLPTPALHDAFIGQRFWRGAIVFGAGTRTARYRLNPTFEERAVDELFVAIRRSLAWLEAHPGKTPPAWEDLATPREVPLDADIVIRVAHDDEADDVIARVMALEDEIFEPARREPESRLRDSFEDGGIALIAEAAGPAGPDGAPTKVLAGFAFGVALERVAEIHGPAEDPNLGAENTFYSTAVAVAPGFQGRGLGARLKAAQIEAARDLERPDGKLRYHFSTGRNRVGAAETMTHLVRRVGGHVVQTYIDQYGEKDGAAIYYRIPLRPPAAPPHIEGHRDLHVGDPVRRFARVPESLQAAAETGQLFGPAVTKLTVLNYVTPAIVRAIEWIDALTPSLPHLFLTNSRDELVDKGLRVLRYHRKGASVAIGLDGGYLGHTTAAARSLSDPATHRMGAPYFDWPRVPHPCLGDGSPDAGVAAMIAGIEAAIAAAGGADKVFGIFVEPVQERTGRTLSDPAWLALGELRKRTGVPIVAVETATAAYRGGEGAFLAERAPIAPDMLCWWAGGQLGVIHVSDRYWVPAPLAMASTWDGDELSLIRTHHHLRAARRLDLAATTRAFSDRLWPLEETLGAVVDGRGLFRVVRGAPPGLVDVFAKHRVLARELPSGNVVIAPPLDVSGAELDRLGEAVQAAASALAPSGRTP
jgi:RHH-type proline utilization regulon transcriptional repressor/proline dehydrogenase/delta 1-pyrroline-5-carboxylate dehydrogenase